MSDLAPDQTAGFSGYAAVDLGPLTEAMRDSESHLPTIGSLLDDISQEAAQTNLLERPLVGEQQAELNRALERHKGREDIERVVASALVKAIENGMHGPTVQLAAAIGLQALSTEQDGLPSPGTIFAAWQRSGTDGNPQREFDQADHTRLVIGHTLTSAPDGIDLDHRPPIYVPGVFHRSVVMDNRALTEIELGIEADNETLRRVTFESPLLEYSVTHIGYEQAASHEVYRYDDGGVGTPVQRWRPGIIAAVQTLTLDVFDRLPPDTQAQAATAYQTLRSR